MSFFLYCLLSLSFCQVGELYTNISFFFQMHTLFIKYHNLTSNYWWSFSK